MELEDHLFFLCTQVVHRRDRALGVVLRPLGLLSTEWRVLGTLVNRGPLAMTELAQWTAYERTRLTKLLEAMAQRKWVERTASSTDRRTVVVTIGAAGRRIYARAQPQVDALNETILGTVAKAGQVQARTTLQSLRATLIGMGY